MTDGRRATIFGGEAEQYDRFRPRYPSEVIDVVVEHRPETAVDVGCGTGKAAVQVASRGVEVLGVEPDARMAEVARRHGIAVIISDVEHWKASPCDVMYSAQAWHWVDPIRGAEVAAESVRSGGRWAALWNYERDEHFGAARDSVYRRLAPELIDPPPDADADREFLAAIDAGLRSTKAFGSLVGEEFEWTDRVQVDVAVQRLATHSAHRLLAPDHSAAVEDALRRELGAPTEMLDLSYVARVLTADRR